MNIKQIEISSTLASTIINIIVVILIMFSINLSNKKEELIEIGFGIVGGGSGGGGTDQINNAQASAENISKIDDKELINKKAVDNNKDNVKSPPSTNKTTEDESIKSTKNKSQKNESTTNNDILNKGKGGKGTNPEGTGIGNGTGPGSGNGNGSGSGEGNGVGDGWSIDFGGRVRKIYSYLIPNYPEGVSKDIDIKLKFTILPDGTVGTIFPLIKADSRLESTAINSLRQWRFEPIPAQQKQQIQTAIITFPFRLK